MPRIFTHIVFLFFCSFSLFSQTAGPLNSGTQNTVNADNSNWSTTGNVTASDNTYAEILGTSFDNSNNSDILQLSNFGFAIPCGNKIDGITVEIERNMYTGTVRDLVIQLIDASGTQAGNNYADLVTNWPAADPNTYVTYGGSADTWGLTLTRSEVNNANFGVAIQLKAFAGNTTLAIDHVRMKIWYSPIGPIVSAGVGPADWNTASSWSPAIIPESCSDVTILSGHSIRVSTSPASAVNSLTIASGGILELRNNLTLAVTNDLNLSGAVNGTTAGTGKINIGGNLHTFPGSSLGATPPSTRTSTFNVSGTWTVEAGGSTIAARCNVYMLNAASTTTVNGDLIFGQSGTGVKAFRDIFVSATGTWDNTVGEDPRIDGNIVNNGSWIGPTGGTCDYQFGRYFPGTFTISGNPVAISRLSLYQGSTVTNLGTVIIDGNVSPGIRQSGGGGNVTFNNGNGITGGVLYLANTGGNVSVDLLAAGLVFNASFANNTVHYSRAGNQDIRVPDDNCYFDLICENSGTKTVQGGTTGIIDMLTIQNDAIVDVGTNTLKDGCGGNAGLTMTGNSQLLLSKCTPTAVPELTGTYFLTGGRIVLNGNCNQTYNSSPTGASTVNDITFSTSGEKTITGIATINGNVTVSGSATLSGNSAFSMNCSKSFTYNSTGNTTLGNNVNIGSFSHSNTGDIIDAGYTITVCGSSWDRTTATNDFVPTGKVIFNPSSGTCTMTSSAAGNITRFHDITINPAKILIADVQGINVGNGGGAFFTNDGTFTHNSGTVTIIDNTSVQGASVTTFNHLTISAGTLTGHANEIKMQGDWTNNSAFTHNNGKVTFEAGNAQSLAGSATTTFFNLDVNKTVGAILTQNATTASVANLLTLTEGIFDINALTLNGGGGFTATGGDLQLAKTTAPVPELTGTYSITGGTVTLDGAGVQTLRTAPVGASTYFNLMFTTSGAKTITGLLTIDGNVTVSGSATLTANSAFTQAASKIFTYNSSGTTTLSAATNVTIGRYVQSAGGGTLNINGSNFIVSGSSWNKSNGTFSTSGRVIFQGSVLQTFTHNANTFANVTINNSNGLQLSSNIPIQNDLTFSSGNIVTGGNYVILTTTAATVTGAGSATGFVDGNLRKLIAAGASVQTFEVGNVASYAPVVISFPPGTTSNYFTARTTNGDSPDIYASTINPNKTVNRYWTFTNNGLTIGGGGYTVTFNFLASDIDVGCDVLNNVIVQRYDGVSWNTMTDPVRAATSSQVPGVTTPTSPNTESYQIGEDYNAALVWTRVTGGGNLWSNLATWIQERTGTITTSTLSTTVTGVGTSFTTELAVNDFLITQSSPGTVIGQIQSITNDLTLILFANAATNNAGQAYGREKVPDINDQVNIGNSNVLPPADVTVIQDMALAECNRLSFTSSGQNNLLTHNGGTTLSVISSVRLRQPNVDSRTNTWDINTGTVNVGGNVQIGSGDGTPTRVSKVTMNSGTLNIGTNLLFYNTTAANAVLDMTPGAGIVNLSGSFSLSSAGQLLTNANESVFNYKGSNPGGQTVTFSAGNITYKNLYFNNTGAAGVTSNSSLTTVNVKGDVRAQAGTFILNGANSIAINAGRTFEVVNGATFRITGNTTNPALNTASGTFTFGPTSNTQYWQTNNQNIASVASPGYGNLSCQPSADGLFQYLGTAAGQTIYVQGDLTVGNMINTCTVNMDWMDPVVSVLGNVIINTNASVVPSATDASTWSIGKNWTLDGALNLASVNLGTIIFNGSIDQEINGTSVTQTFAKFVVTKTPGTTLSVGGFTTSLSVNNLTVNSGAFAAPASLSLNTAAGGPPNNSIALNGGTFTAGSLTIIIGDWTNNGGTFDPNGGLVQFVQGSTQNINGTTPSQTFFDVEVNKSGSSVRISGSTTTVTMNNYTQTAMPFASSNVGATVNINGNFTLTSGSFNNVVNPGTGISTLNIMGNILYNSASTWSMSQNVKLNGTTTQTIGGSQTIPAFTNFTIDNSFPATAVTLNQPISVNGAFTLTNGHLVTDLTNIITLADAATVVLNAPVSQDNSFVKGPMAYIESTNGVPAVKEFPVGKDNLMHKIDLNITQSSAGANTYLAIYYLASDPEFAATSGWALPADNSLDKVSAIGHWDLSKSGGASVSNASVKLYYISSDDAPVDADLRVAKGNSSPWSNLGGTGNGTSITSTTNFTTFSRFALANRTGGGNPLPIDLLAFDASPNGEAIDLTWTTATEVNNAYFTVEKSQDGKIFENVIVVMGAGNSSEPLEYETRDNKPYNGTSFYRLKQTDFDGKTSYSDIVPVKFSAQDAVVFTIFPNPSDGKNIYIRFKGNEKNEEVLVVLNDMAGKLVYSKVVLTDDNGSFVFAVDTENRLPAGIYLVVGSSKNDIYSRKLVIR